MLPSIESFYTKFEVSTIDKSEFSKYYEEAIFQIDLMNKLKMFSTCSTYLEIGSGIGLVAAYLGSKGYNVTTIDPLEGSFSNFVVMKNLVESHPFLSKIESKNQIKNSVLTFNTSRKFNFIYSFNSLQFISPTSELIAKIETLLEDGGEFYFICPNYSFPYEQHFNFPIIINRNLTKTFLKFFYGIKNKEFNEEKWNELVWIKQRELKRLIQNYSNLSIHFESHAQKSYLQRIKSDSGFMDRKGKFIVKMLRFLPNGVRVPSRFSPIIECRITKSNY